MKKKGNQIKQPVIIVGYVIVLLFIMSFFKLPIGLFSNPERMDILADIREATPKKAITDSIKKDTFSFSKNIPPPTDPTLIEDYGWDSANSLNYFYQKLDSAILPGHKKVRVAYFGDSFIEGDEVTDELRLQLQKHFGGNGIGFVPMQSGVAGIYSQIVLKSNQEDWIDYNFRLNPKNYPLGMSGHLFFTKSNSEVEYLPKTEKPLMDVKIFTGRVNTEPVFTITKDGKPELIRTSGKDLINENILNKQTPIKSLKISTNSEGVPIYGVSLEDSQGVYLDNYSFRGNTSLETLKVPIEVMKKLNNYLQYDLVIIHYGINAIEHDKQKFTWFENSMHNLIENIRKGFGNNIPILLVSTSDIGYKYEGEYTTEKAVPYMVETQREIARKNKVAFWNLFKAIGGEGTIVNWVEGDTVFAYKDYTHVNEKGAKKVGDLFFDKLMASKKYYQQPTITKK